MPIYTYPETSGPKHDVMRGTFVKAFPEHGPTIMVMEQSKPHSYENGDTLKMWVYPEHADYELRIHYFRPEKIWTVEVHSLGYVIASARSIWAGDPFVAGLLAAVVAENQKGYLAKLEDQAYLDDLDERLSHSA